ncbi:FixH family protein [Hoeflea prorocentri]|uniref:FixH family protein n=1 Tax=Hoeflea prorocentri TaxID=1922333 RepID=A0A9X3ZH11_9HYPH|nr:FixH family protein [Hoeflea prorocentri]MCY6381342.1 FixH family protein [Hoeflea prorocentri]MDA5399142.1 FixH family protein [Hoeflea prorocentri]
MQGIQGVFRGPFTGWHMLGFMGLFYGVIISVNLTLAYFAGSSWSGLIVKNTYVASQQFDDEVARVEAMKARGWSSALEVDAGSVRYQLTNALGTPIEADSVSVVISSPVEENSDRTLELDRQGDGSYYAAHEVNPGQWLIKIKAMRDSDVLYSDVQRVFIKADEES